MKQKLLISTLALFIVGCASMLSGVPEANAGQLVSIVESRYITPPTAPMTDSIANGGFFISGYGRGGSIGDGGDESTAWFHSFHLNRPQWSAFQEAYNEARETASKKIVIRSAKLELKYSPRVSKSFNGNDYIQITGLKGIAIKSFDGFIRVPPTDLRERQTVSIELLADDRYTSEDILAMLNLGRERVAREREHDSEDGREPGLPYTAQSGVFLMRYADDAIIHYAKLTLEYALGYNSSAQNCSARIQGKIAWDYKGSKQWNQVNLKRLCRGAENSGEPAACFQRVMHGGVNWGGGTQWKWENAIDLCEGSQNADSTIQCFEQELTKKRTWQQAIRTCSN